MIYYEFNTKTKGIVITGIMTIKIATGFKYLLSINVEISFLLSHLDLITDIPDSSYYIRN